MRRVERLRLTKLDGAQERALELAREALVQKPGLALLRPASLEIVKIRVAGDLALEGCRARDCGGRRVVEG